MITVDATGQVCPVPVVMTKKAVGSLTADDDVEILTDNPESAANLEKMAQQKGFPVTSQKLDERHFRVVMHVTAEQARKEREIPEPASAETVCPAEHSCGTVVVCSSGVCGTGDDELGKILIKSFFFSLTQLDVPPKTFIFYNGGAKLTCEGSPVLEDIQTQIANGADVMTCGTCLKHYGLTDRLRAGRITNMYEIAETMTGAKKLVKP